MIVYDNHNIHELMIIVESLSSDNADSMEFVKTLK